MARLRIPILSGALLLAGCETTTRHASGPPPMPVVAPPPPAAVASDWRDRPYSPGTWRYVQDEQGSIARFGDSFALRCLRANRAITLAMNGVPTATMLGVRTSYGRKDLPATGGVATLGGADSLLDQIAFTRGRFSVEAVGGTAMVIMPAWAEPARVIEDCRG